MKRGIFVIGLLLASKWVFAEARPFIGGNIGALGGNAELETSIIGGGQLGISGDYLGASVNFLYYSKENKVKTLSKGSFSMTPIMFNAFGKIPLKKADGTEVAAIRLGGGVSYILVSHEVDSSLTNIFKSVGLTYKEEVDSGLGYQVNGGVDFWLNNHISIGADIIYLFFKPSAKATLTSIATGASLSVTSDIKLDTVIGLSTIKYHF